MKIYPKMNRSNTALLVIDPVNSCAHEKCETPEWNIHFSKIRAMIPKLSKFVGEYRKKVGGLIVFTTITPWDKEHLPDNLNELYTDPKARYYSDDKSDFDEQFHDIAPDKNDLVVAKNTYDAFTNEEMITEFKKKGIKYVIVAGVFTDGCILASIIGGFSKGYNFIILKDLIETTDSRTRQELQKSLIEYTFPIMYGKTITSKQLLQESF